MEENPIKKVIDGILELAEKERKESQPYKDMFKKTEGKPFCVQLRDIENEMMGVVLNYCSVLNENGYKVNNETFRFLLSLPILVKHLEEDIVKKEGRVCSVDKVYTLLHQEFKKLLNSK